MDALKDTIFRDMRGKILPIPKKNRYATRAASKPVGLPPAPYEPAPSAAKRRMMIVDAKSDHFREK